MKRFMTSSALAIVLGTSAMADGHTAMFSDVQFDAAINLTASDLLGARVYATEMSVADASDIADPEAGEWDDIGEINEIILTRDGMAQSVIVGVGGFLGMGEKDVSVNMSDLRFISDGADADEYFVVINANKAGITDATPYDRSAMLEDDAMVHTAVAPMIEREGYMAATPEDLTAEKLTGARVYGVGDEDVGEIGALLLTADGQVDRAVIDVGGFLGMGERPVAVPLTELTIIRNDGGDDIRVYIESSQEALEARPVYEG